MRPSKTDAPKTASSWYAVNIIGGDMVFLVDRRRGHKLFMDPGRRLTPPEIRQFAYHIDCSLRKLSLSDFKTKYNIRD